MTDHEQEQIDELESLECLYPNAFSRDPDAPNKKFSIDIVPHQDSDEPNHVAIKLFVTYTDQYPDESAQFRVEIVKGLKDKHCKELTNLIAQISDDNLCSPMMFTICTEVQEWLVHRNVPCDTSLHDQMKAQKELKARLQRLTFGHEEKTDHHTQAEAHCATDFDIASYQRAKGTPVTTKTFQKWAEVFLEHYRKEQTLKFEQMYGDDKRERLTGVQIFEQNAKEKLMMDTEDADVADSDDNEEQATDSAVNANEDKKKRKKKKKKEKDNKTVVVGDANSQTTDTKTVHITDESLFLDDMPDF
eukprot:CAMPEP_0202692884 /NCGR_PEP_ID=MMETSP1385-20130828/7153_1 /ASSEMBLY_ACC=CAM_ASM_000861 /TAXON_ID=933848 /ORGANISM="Elphidium margaritaceum" /LENGTH=302 /DNA_ID=CAMNT_0049348487 /DNA_START=26 /DNA_END=934 /DNA_ORIENTATION=+